MAKINPATQISFPGQTEPLDLSDIVAIEQNARGVLKQIFTITTLAHICGGKSCGFDSYIMEGSHTEKAGRVHFSLSERTGFLDAGNGIFVNPENIIAGVIDKDGKQSLLLRGGISCSVAPEATSGDNAPWLLKFLPEGFLEKEGTFTVGAKKTLAGTVFVNPAYWDKESGQFQLDSQTTKQYRKISARPISTPLPIILLG